MPPIKTRKNSKKSFQFAGFWIRLAAAFIDALIIIPVAFISGFTPFIGDYLAPILGVAYAFIMEGLYGATFGKKAVGLTVVDEKGVSPIDLEKSLIRQLGKWISAMILFIGFIMIAFDAKKQGLHDRIARTYVVRKKE